MSLIIDRRLNAKKKSTVNRQRFLKRYRHHVKAAVQDAIDQRSITDVDSGSDITIPRKDLSEPFFHHGQEGHHGHVHPGNHGFHRGDRIQRPPGGGGQGSGAGQASDRGEGADEFVFQINRDEFLEYLFDDLELPNLLRKELKDSTDYQLKRAGFTTAGSPDRLNIVRSLRAAHARRIALSGKDRKVIRTLKRQLREMEVSPDPVDQQQATLLQEEIKSLNRKLKRLPFIDDFDLRFNNMTKVPQPSSKAVMFCVMDVSGSMTQEIKDMAKRFFLLLYLFLERNYEAVEVVFIRHHSEARECDEHDFFYARETGGTIVSKALLLTHDIIQQRYPSGQWNIYIAQASDGDNWGEDSSTCTNIILDKLLPVCQYFAYVEITGQQHQNLWYEYANIAESYPDHFAMQHIHSYSDIYPTFRRLFAKKEDSHVGR